jgi:hypothetical protein
LEVDHVLMAVDDLDASAAVLEARHGLRSVAGGRHPGWGTANRIVPLGDAYLELVAVADAGAAAGSAFGRWVAGAADGALLGWAVRVGDLDGVAARLGLTVDDGSRVRDDGRLLRWRLAGVERAAAEPALPFFIAWGEGTPFPGTAPEGHPRLAGLSLRGDAERLAAWLGPHELPIEVRPGAPGVVAVRLASPTGEIV